ncbi:MAG: hypothetical protein JWP87_5622 [Labilithrix sp.]|nr:hypothetical protein [Labilithrix sp.]
MSLYAGGVDGIVRTTGDCTYPTSQRFVRFPKDGQTTNGKYTSAVDPSRVVTLESDSTAPVCGVARDSFSRWYYADAIVRDDGVFWARTAGDPSNGNNLFWTMSWLAPGATAAKHHPRFNRGNNFNPRFLEHSGKLLVVNDATTSTQAISLPEFELKKAQDLDPLTLQTLSKCSLVDKVVAMTGGFIYYLDKPRPSLDCASGTAAHLVRTGLDGSAPQNVADIPAKFAIANVGTSWIVGSAGETLLALKTDGSDRRILGRWRAPVGHGYVLAADDTGAYLLDTGAQDAANTGAVYRYPISGSGPVVLAAQRTASNDMALGRLLLVDDKFVYWMEHGASGGDTTIDGRTWAALRISKDAPGETPLPAAGAGNGAGDLGATPDAGAVDPNCLAFCGMGQTETGSMACSNYTPYPATSVEIVAGQGCYLNVGDGGAAQKTRFSVDCRTNDMCQLTGDYLSCKKISISPGGTTLSGFLYCTQSSPGAK